MRFELCHPDCATADAASIVVASGWATAPAAPGAASCGAVEEAELRVESPRLWWPRGYGGQPLYELRARLNGSDDGAWLSRRVGLRTVRLVQNAAAAPPPATRQAPPSISR